ncbi:hypothetical protein EVAR_70112_1 [Eumeta japonica]|uniref:Vacuolar sorting protein 39/Transforming growth factor beta receptor-associated domain-containing protein n=1 Tax=Eumeta variegata TaxID=151549 RepID=A0A4C1SE64_EUMVA|nr:hypothetical protein EVAR_70112_1 [Eumeta japonica]
MWSSPLLGLVWDEPFVVGRISSGIEIRCLENNGIDKETLVQSIPELSKIKHLVRSAKEYFDEPELSKADTIRQIHMRYAKELFALKQFSAAMSEFEKAQANPYDVIRLFPNLLQDQNKTTANDSYDAAVPVASMLQLEDKDLENAILSLIEFLALARQKEVEESEKTLLKHDKISELIILYQTNGKHKKALELLKSQAYKEGSSLYGYERTIRYLQQLGSSHWPLIMEFSDWVLKANPEQGLRIFTEDFIEVENLQRPFVLDFLLTHHKTLVIPYLEHVVNVWKDENTLIHTILIKQYREKVENIMKDLSKENDSEKQICMKN